VAGALIVGLAVAADNHSSQKVDSPMAEMMKTAEDLAEMIRESERRCGAKIQAPTCPERAASFVDLLDRTIGRANDQK